MKRIVALLSMSVLASTSHAACNEQTVKDFAGRYRIAQFVRGAGSTVEVQTPYAGRMIVQKISPLAFKVTVQNIDGQSTLGTAQVLNVVPHKTVLNFCTVKVTDEKKTRSFTLIKEGNGVSLTVLDQGGGGDLGNGGSIIIRGVRVK